MDFDDDFDSYHGSDLEEVLSGGATPTSPSNGVASSHSRFADFDDLFAGIGGPAPARPSGKPTSPPSVPTKPSEPVRRTRPKEVATPLAVLPPAKPEKPVGEHIELAPKSRGRESRSVGSRSKADNRRGKARSVSDRPRRPSHPRSRISSSSRASRGTGGGSGRMSSAEVSNMMKQLRLYKRECKTLRDKLDSYAYSIERITQHDNEVKELRSEIKRLTVENRTLQRITQQQEKELLKPKRGERDVDNLMGQVRVQHEENRRLHGQLSEVRSSLNEMRERAEQYRSEAGRLRDALVAAGISTEEDIEAVIDRRAQLSQVTRERDASREEVRNLQQQLNILQKAKLSIENRLRGEIVCLEAKLQESPSSRTGINISGVGSGGTPTQSPARQSHRQRSSRHRKLPRSPKAQENPDLKSPPPVKPPINPAQAVFSPTGPSPELEPEPVMGLSISSPAKPDLSLEPAATLSTAPVTVAQDPDPSDFLNSLLPVSVSKPASSVSVSKPTDLFPVSTSEKFSSTLDHTEQRSLSEPVDVVPPISKPEPDRSIPSKIPQESGFVDPLDDLLGFGSSEDHVSTVKKPARPVLQDDVDDLLGFVTSDTKSKSLEPSANPFAGGGDPLGDMLDDLLM